ncbi:MAG: hypothetical protein VCE12_21730 [Candidatus Latescibacterota bacterium]
MANPEHIVLVKTGSECWNQWRWDHPNIVPDLRGADLCSVGSLWLTELGERMSLAEQHCPHLLERLASTS